MKDPKHSDKHLFRFLIFEFNHDITAYHFAKPKDEAQFKTFIKEGFSIKKIRFPYKGEILEEEVIVSNRDLPHMTFIMAVRRLEAEQFTFNKVWDSPILNLKNEVLTGGWQKQVCDNILDELIERFKQAKIPESTVTLFLALLTRAKEESQNLANELLFVSSGAIIDYPPFTATRLYTSISQQLGIPQPHNLWDPDEHEFSRSLCRKIIDNNWKMTETLEYLSKLIFALESRSIEIESFHIVHELFFKQQHSKLDWLNKETAYRLLRLLQDESLDQEEIAQRMKYSENYHQCFISFSSKDINFAEKLHADLVRSKVRCWFSPKDVQGGKKLYDQLDVAIKSQDKTILLLSEASMSSAWVKTEIAKTRKRELDEGISILFPISIVEYDKIKEWENFDADIGADSAKEIREYFIIDFSNWHDQDEYKRQFNRLLNGLEKESD